MDGGREGGGDGDRARGMSRKGGADGRMEKGREGPERRRITS